MSSPTKNNSAFRVAILGIYHESNSFLEEPTTLEDFKTGRWLKGQSIIDEYKDAYHEIGGALEIFQSAGIDPVPVFYAETTPGGIIREEAYDQLVAEMMNELNNLLPVDACFIVPHGAAVAEKHPDMDGDWISMLQKKIGKAIPIVGTLDPHSNVSEAMIRNTQGLFPYSTNPHVDQRETGKKAALFLLDILHKKINPLQELFQAPLAISIDHQNTSDEPCKSFYEFAKGLSSSKNVLHVNIAIGFPYADVQEMGTSAIIITDNDPVASAKVCEELKNYLLRPGIFEPLRLTFEQQWQENNSRLKPILLLDMGDNIGGGGPGNSTYILDKLDEQHATNTLSCIYDPRAVKTCLETGPGKEFSLSVGNNPETGKAYNAVVKLISIHDGRFEEKEPRHGGQLHYNMGPTAVVRTGKGHTIILNSLRVPPFSLGQVRSCNLNPGDYETIIAKGVIAPIAAYGPVCPTIVRVNSPGITQADMTKFSYRNRRKPLYPFENIAVCSDLTP